MKKIIGVLLAVCWAAVPLFSSSEVEDGFGVPDFKFDGRVYRLTASDEVSNVYLPLKPDSDATLLFTIERERLVGDVRDYVPNEDYSLYQVNDKGDEVLAASQIIAIGDGWRLEIWRVVKTNNEAYIYKFQIEMRGLEKGSNETKSAFFKLEKLRPNFVKAMRQLKLPAFYDNQYIDETFLEKYQEK